MGDTRRGRQAPRSPLQRVGGTVSAAGGPDSDITKGATLLTSVRTIIGFFLAVAIAVLLAFPGTRDWTCMHTPKKELLLPKVCDRAYPINAYLTEDPDIPPEKRSDDRSLLGIEERTTVEDVDAMFPPSAPHKSAPGYARVEGQPVTTHFESWTWRGVTVDVEFDNASGGAVNVTARREDAEGDYASLPRGLLLGQATVADAIEAFDFLVDGFSEELDFFYYSVALSYEGEESAEAVIVADRPVRGDPDYERGYGDSDRPLQPGDVACERVFRLFRLYEADDPVGWHGEQEDLGDCSAHLFEN